MNISRHMTHVMTAMQVRILTGLGLSAFGLMVILAFPEWAFIGFMSLMTLGLGYEWFRLSCTSGFFRGAALLVMFTIGLMLFLLLSPNETPWLAGAAMFGWLLLMAGLWQNHRIASRHRPAWFRTLLGVLILPLFWYAVIEIHRQPEGPWLLIFGVMIVAVADSLAYFAGRAWGRRKLAPALSPGKTIEGLVGGLVGVGVLTAIGAALPLFETVPSWQLALWSMGVALFSVAGDLEESRLKREAGAKDSGQLLPGHGGLLDRLDGHLAAMPVWLLALAQMHFLTLH
ncbi:MAG: phosphatidate cytidylyltransferase [Halothiobacillus sp.]|jgi:phosphatidate cytidylyltransferase|nr:phosphatidate cytidylyltransferase [Halothiobacillus sp.]